ncbi:MAG: hypothetical protein HKO07_05805 [Pseudomonadales bacterium]|nr:hypothetical protein [Pseudomonadales bacterium]
MVPPPDTAPELLREAREFLAHFRSVQLATVNKAGEPLASYAPFVRLPDGSLCMLLSELAAHTRNLQDNPIASLLFIEPEAEATEIFARRRLVCSCRARLYRPGTSEREAVVHALQARFGDIAEQLASLPDFYGVILEVDQVSFVSGFAKANTLPAKDLFRGIS